MARQFKPVRFFVMMSVAAFAVCGVTAFYTHRAAHGRTAEERAAYAIGERAGEQAPRDTKWLRSISSRRELATSRLGTSPSKTVTRTGSRKRIRISSFELKDFERPSCGNV